jgi:hypothetical protein
VESNQTERDFKMKAVLLSIALLIIAILLFFTTVSAAGV